MAVGQLSVTSRLVAITAIALTAVAFSPGTAVAQVPDVVVSGLNAPRGLDIGPGGRLTYAEANGVISRTDLITGTTAVLGRVPSDGFAPAVAQSLGRTYALTGAGDPARGAGKLYRVSQTGGARPVADILAYQAVDTDPFDLEGLPEDSNPYGVEALFDGSVLIADAAGNDLLRVHPDGEIVTVARIKPRVVPFPPGYPPGFPPPGTPIPSEAVPTSVTVGADGFYYVGELRGFPATPGTSLIWRIHPDAVDAVCDPEAPDVGDCQVYADGFTSIQDVAAGTDGGLYVLELVKGSWFALEFGLTSPRGGLFRIPPGGGEPTELAVDQLTLPSGLAVRGPDKVFVAGPLPSTDGKIARITV